MLFVVVFGSVGFCSEVRTAGFSLLRILGDRWESFFVLGGFLVVCRSYKGLISGFWVFIIRFVWRGGVGFFVSVDVG